MAHLIARDDLLTPKRASAVTGLPVETLRYLMRVRRIPFERLPGSNHRRIRRSVAVSLTKRSR